MVFARKVRAFAIASGLLLLALLLGPDVLAKVYLNTSACYLSRALIAQPGNQGDLERSIELCQEVLQMQPDDTSATRLLLRASLEDKASGSSVSMDTSSLSSHGDTLSVFYLGKNLWNSGNEREATDLWRSLEHSEYYFMNLGHRAYAEGDLEMAVANYRLSLSIEDTPTGRKDEMYRNLCKFESSQGKYEEARLWCSQAVEVRRTVWNLLQLGRVYLTAGDYPGALPILEEARDLGNDVAGVHYSLALAHRRLGHLNLAQQNYEEALYLSPTDQYINSSAGQFYVQLGEFEKAYCCYERVVQHASSQRLLSAAKGKLDELKKKISVPECKDFLDLRSLTPEILP